MAAKANKTVQTVSTTSPTAAAFTHQEPERVKIAGILTSQIQLRGEKSKEPYHIELIGRYSHSEKSIRKSFTCFDYHINKECFACGDNFSTTQQLDYDYCSPSG
ncbi:MAG: hypothetical protein NY202_01785, partial [Mollicutes bacterium UO1]